MLVPFVALAELISIAVNASVGSNTMVDPDLKETYLLKTLLT